LSTVMVKRTQGVFMEWCLIAVENLRTIDGVEKFGLRIHKIGQYFESSQRNA